METQIRDKLISLYGEKDGNKAARKIEEMIRRGKKKLHCPNQPLWNEKDIILISYADSFRAKHSPPLKTLLMFLQRNCRGLFSILHILPFSPFSSDRGFSVIDHRKVKKEFGSWNDIASLARRYRIMRDLVLNHVSTKNRWFQKFLKGDQKYENYFIHFSSQTLPPAKLIKKVFRPRPTPLLTKFKTAKGDRFVWTTFSVEGTTDQVDLNFRHPEVLLEIIKILFFHGEKGVKLFRLDAVAYIWKELGTTCINHPRVHTLVSLLRAVLDRVCPSALLITETNVPHKENISYFGDGYHEAQLVYNFSLPPLVLDAFYRGNATRLSKWAKKIKKPSPRATFINLLDSHDGIGISGAKGILSENAINSLFKRIADSGGMLSRRRLPNGRNKVYEMNSTWWSALNGDEKEPFERQLQKFITSRAIAFSLIGIPAVYYLSLVGMKNDSALFKKTGIKRDLNRTNLLLEKLEKQLSNKNSREAKIFSAMSALIKKRKARKAFHPNAPQQIVELDERVFSLLRGEEREKILALHNVSHEKVDVCYRRRHYRLPPYGYLWVNLDGEK